MNKYISTQIQKIGLLVYGGKPLNEYTDKVKIQLHHVNGSTNWIDVRQDQLEKIIAALDS
jgi:hypothetical protein